MRIVFFGSPDSAIPSLKKMIETGHEVKLVVTQPDRPKGRGKNPSPPPVKRMAMDLSIPCLQPERIRKDPDIAQIIASTAPELIVVVAYGQIIPSSIIYLPPHHSLNVHFSLLPGYRGAAPVQWALLNGERKTGITIFELNEKMDEGDILSQEEVEIHPGERALELEARLSERGAELLIQTIARLDTIEPKKQDHSQATYAPKLKKEDGLVDWTKDASFIERQVRAFNPWPSTYAFIKEKRFKIIEGIGAETSFKPSSPGTILEIGKAGIEVCCGRNSVYRIKRLQPENKKEMDAYAFTLGAGIKPGDTFT